MSGALGLRWLNDELSLHRRVSVLERDLSNGYMFAEILHQRGLEKRFDQYQDDMTLEAKVHNMELLAQTLDTLRIAFPIKTRRAIMMEERSAVLQFLLQLKDILERRSGNNRAPPAATVSSKRTAATGSSVGTDQAGAGTSGAPSPPPQDVEKRFVATVAHRYQPTTVGFRKDVNMSVYLRSFEQAQWKAESDLRDVS